MRFRRKKLPDKHMSGASMQAFCQRHYATELATRHYPLPAWLDYPSVPWQKALATLYREPVSFPASISPQQGLLIHALVANIRPRFAVEIGSFIGCSSIWIGSALRDAGQGGQLHGVDRFYPILPRPPLCYGYADSSLQLAERHRAIAELEGTVFYHQEDSAHPSEHLLRLLEQNIVDFLFIDGDHSIEGCVGDFTLYAPYLASGGYLLLHDTNPAACGWQGPRHLIDHCLRESPDFEVFEFPTAPQNYGLALARKVGHR
jgi:predicted O-methyltransferase YrrM